MGIIVSDTDSFIEEVTEEVRRDQLFQYVKRYGWIAVALVLLIVGTSAYLEWQKAQNTAKAQAAGDAVLAAMENDDPAQRLAALGDLSIENAEAEAVVALISANVAKAADDVAAAVAKLNEVATDSDVPAEYQQMAALKALMLQGASLSADERLIGYQALATPGMPFRMLALEQIALIAVEQGQFEDAITQLEAIRADAEASSGLRGRAAQLIVAMGYEPAEVNTLSLGTGN